MPHTAIIATVDHFKQALDGLRKANREVQVDCSTNNATVFLSVYEWQTVSWQRIHMDHLHCESAEEAQLVASLLQITFCA